MPLGKAKKLSLLHTDDLRVCGVENASKKTAFIYFLTHPEYKAVVIYRWFLSFYAKGGIHRAISKFLWLRTIKNTGCFLSPKATIGKGLSLPHPTGIVIGDGSVLGDNVTIYQNVTLGQKGGTDAYPTIGNNVTIYAGACLIGDITIGDGAVVGANSVVTKDVDAKTTVAGVPAKVLNTKA